MRRIESDRGVYLEGENSFVLFVPWTMQLFSAPKPSGDATLYDWIAENHELSPEIPRPRAGGARSRLSGRPTMIPMVAADPGRGIAPSRQAPVVQRLTINVSNACNLWCSYCYADHGHYHSPASLMPPERAVAIVDAVLANYRSIGTVQFFGGEPLSNLEAIEATCTHLEGLVRQGRLSATPQFVATTNGTYSQPKVLEALKRWKIALTVSFDGPREVHDAGRPMVSGGSSYDRIRRSLDRFRAEEIPFDIECTYNRRHLDAGIEVLDLLSFFEREIGVDAVHISPAFQPQNDGGGSSSQTIFRGAALEQQVSEGLRIAEILPQFRRAARDTVLNAFAGAGPQLDFAKRILDQIVHQRPSGGYCPAFFDQLSIAIDGTVFPCFMFIGDDRFNMGNILTDAFPNPKSEAVLARYFDEFGTEPNGTAEWYAPLASGCIAGDYVATSSMRTRWMAPMFEAMAEECLVAVAECSHRIDDLEAA